MPSMFAKLFSSDGAPQQLEKINSTLREKCPYSESFWSVFSGIRSGYGEILRISPYSVQMRANTKRKNSEYRHFSRIEKNSFFRESSDHINMMLITCVVTDLIDLIDAGFFTL